MSRPKRTRWFNVSKRPVRKGLYEVAYDGIAEREAILRLWDGQRWRSSTGDSTLFGISSRDVWRGLAENPNA